MVLWVFAFCNDVQDPNLLRYMIYHKRIALTFLAPVSKHLEISHYLFES